MKSLKGTSLILLEIEEYVKKEPAPSSTPATNRRIQSPSSWDQSSFYDWNNFDSDQNGDHPDNHIAVQESPSYFNYHSLMTKTPIVAWSKLDTKLFYKQLFPGRTRTQIKLKYKKSSNMHRNTEAFENRAFPIFN